MYFGVITTHNFLSTITLPISDWSLIKAGFYNRSPFKDTSEIYCARMLIRSFTVHRDFFSYETAGTHKAFTHNLSSETF